MPLNVKLDKSNSDGIKKSRCTAPTTVRGLTTLKCQISTRTHRPNTMSI